MSGGRTFTPSRLLEVIKKYQIGNGRKGLKSQSTPPKKVSSGNKSLSFTKPVTLTWNSKTRDYRNSTSVTIPSNFWNIDLSDNYSNLGIDSFLEITITNPGLGISATHTYKTDERHRITLPSKLLNHYGIIHKTQTEFQVLEHIPASQIGRYLGPVTCIANIKIYNEGIARVNIPEKLKELTSLSQYQKDKFIQWKFGDREGVGRLYPDTTIGVSPYALGLSPDTNSINAEFTIVNSNLSAHDVNKLTDNSRAQFVKTHLKEIETFLGVQFTGDPKADKEPIGRRLSSDLINGGHLKDIQSIERKEEGSKFEAQEENLEKLKPDAIGNFSDGEDILIEEKFFAKNTQFSQSDIDQMKAYKATGNKVGLITTKDESDVPSELRELVDVLISYEDLKKAAEDSGDPIYADMLEKIRNPWP